MEQPQSNNRKSRLMISKMELENFKSYAGVQPIGPFHKSFSSIVGPNGSGKSNVIDALLFVFGKKANQMRLKRVSELIHKSSRYPELKYARVSVYFQLIYDQESSEDDFELVPNSEFVISRIAYTDNTSKYTINNKTSSFTEVGQVLRSYDVDLDNNRFLILQGEVEQIAMMKPKAAAPGDVGLLEYLEDIIGSNQYVELIDQSSKVLDEINEQRTAQVQRLKVSEKERDALLDSKLEVETFLQKEKEIRYAKNIQYQTYLYTNTQNIEALQTNLSKGQEKLAYEKNKYKDFAMEMKQIESVYEATKQEHTKLDKELQKATGQYDAFERRDIKIQEDIKYTKNQLKKHQTNFTKDSTKLQDFEKELISLTDGIQKMSVLLQDQEMKKTQTESELNDILTHLQDDTKDMKVTLEIKQHELAEAEKSIGSLQTEKDLLLNQQTLIVSRRQKIQEKIVQFTTKLQTLQESSLNAQQLKDQTKDLQAQMKVHEGLIETLTRELTHIQEEEYSIQQQIIPLQQSIESNKLMLQQQSQSKSQNQLVNKLLQVSQSGGALSKCRIYGRLGDLATISPEYDVAISTACKQLDNILVETTEDAQACIEYLRKYQLGRASFIILNQMKEMEIKMKQQNSQLPAGVPRLFDVIHADNEAFLPAFYLALRDTLVANDLDSAVKIAYVGNEARWRVVTVTGQLIDTSGAMSGGGNDVKKGLMRLSLGSETKSMKTVASKRGSNEEKQVDMSVEYIEKQEKQLQLMQEDIQQLRMMKKDKDNQLSLSQNKIKECSFQLEKLSNQMKHQQEQEHDLITRIQSLEKENQLTSSEQKELTQVETTLQQLEQQIMKVSPNFHSLQQEVNSLQRQILSFGGPKLLKVQSKLDGIQHQIENLTSLTTTKQVEFTNTQKQIEKLTNAIAVSQEEITNQENKLLNLQKEQKEMEDDAMKVINYIESLKSQVQAIEETLSQHSTTFTTMQQEMNKLKSIELDLQVEIERMTAELREQQGQFKHWQSEYNALCQVHLAEQQEFVNTIKSVTDSIFASVKVVSVGMIPVNENAMDVEESSPTSAATSTASAVTPSMDLPEIESLPVFTPEELMKQHMDDIKRQINLLENERNKMKGNMNMNALLEYMKKDANYKIRLHELEEINNKRNLIRTEYEELRRKRLDQFMYGFGSISLKLKEMYQMITLGGDAELELLDSLDPFSEGIAFSVRPPKKSWKQIGNLSGGEKTLSSLALVFALHYYKPTPLYVMDEIDAALDFKNVSIVANYIKERTKNAQFIIISLRNNMFELADRLVGIYKTHDATKSVTINPKLFDATRGSQHDKADENKVSAKANATMEATSTIKSNAVLADSTNRMR